MVCRGLNCFSCLYHDDTVNIMFGVVYLDLLFSVKFTWNRFHFLQVLSFVWEFPTRGIKPYVLVGQMGIILLLALFLKDPLICV